MRQGRRRLDLELLVRPQVFGGEACDGEFSDLTAPALRALVYLWAVTGDERFLDAARRFADAVLALQNADGSWPLVVDRDGERSIDVVGPDDAPNITMSLVRLHRATGHARHPESAVRAVRYGLSREAKEGRIWSSPATCLRSPAAVCRLRARAAEHRPLGWP